MMIESIIKRIKPKIETVNGTKFILIDTDDSVPKSIIYKMYARYMDAAVSIKVTTFKREQKPEQTQISMFWIGENMFNKKLNKTNIGEICRTFGGNGHKGTGGFQVIKNKKDETIVKLMEEIAKKNRMVNTINGE